MFQHKMMLSRLSYSILLQNFIQLLSSTDGNWTVLAVWLGLGLGRRPAFNSRPCFPSEGKGPNWDLGVRTLKLSSEDSEDKLGFWVSRKDHWWTICNCRSGSPIQPSFSISYPDSAFTDPENYFTWGIVIHQCYIKNVISYIVEEE